MFEEFIKNVRTDRYNIMCSIDVHEKHHPSPIDNGSSDGGNFLPSNSKTEALVSLGATIDFIDCWLKFLEHNSLECCNMYYESMKCMFHQIPVELPKPLIYK